jgi:hypothetical protein
VVVIALAVGLAAVRRAGVARVLALALGSALVSWALLEAIYAVYDRPRPEETLDGIGLNGHSWGHLNSFPSGHMAITAALAVATALAFPRLRALMWAYVAAVAFTRVLFGAHFPLDTVAGTLLGTASALLVARILLRERPRHDDTAGTGEPLAKDDVVAVMPSYDDVPTRALVAETLEHVRRLVIVDDGSRPGVAHELDAVAAETGAELVRRPERGGKGSAVRAGVDHALSTGNPAAVLVIDADGQHPASAIPAFLAAGGSAELVIGDRFGNLAAMPLQRRIANGATRRLFSVVAGTEVRDTQNGMRLLGRDAIDLLPAGGYEAETRHLRLALHHGLRVAWVPMPAIYADERSSFRAGRDGLRVLWALVAPVGAGAPSQRRSPRRARSLRARPTRSARPGTFARAQPASPGRAAAA